MESTVTAVMTKNVQYLARFFFITLVAAAEPRGSRMQAKGMDCQSSMAYCSSLLTSAVMRSISRVW